MKDLISAIARRLKKVAKYIYYIIRSLVAWPLFVSSLPFLVLAIVFLFIFGSVAFIHYKVSSSGEEKEVTLAGTVSNDTSFSNFYSLNKSYAEQIINSDQPALQKLFQLVILTKIEENKKEELTGSRISNYMGISTRHLRRLIKVSLMSGSMKVVNGASRVNRYKILGPSPSFIDVKKFISPDDVNSNLLDYFSYISKYLFLSFIHFEGKARSYSNILFLKDVGKLPPQSNTPDYEELDHFKYGPTSSESTLKLPRGKIFGRFAPPSDNLLKELESDILPPQAKREALSRVLESTVDSLEKLLQMVLIIKDEENAEGQLTGKKLAGYIGCSERQVRKLIQKSEKIKIIRGNGKTNQYTLPPFEGIDCENIWTLQEVS